MHARLLAALLAAAPIHMLSLPEGGPSASDAPVDEQTAVLAGIPLGVERHLVEPAEVKQLTRALGAAYAELAAERGPSPTPAFHTLAGQQTPEHFDLLVIPPDGEDHPHRAVIVLHGFGGNFTLQCWLVARAASRAGALTVCPSMSLDAHWTSPQGERIVASTLAWLAAQGRTELVLAGISNGGAGACELGRRFERRLRGAIAISGTSGEGPRALPMLVLHGAHDPLASLAHARAFASKPKRTFVELEGTHFAFLYQRARAGEVIAGWLRGVFGDEPQRTR